MKSFVKNINTKKSTYRLGKLNKNENYLKADYFHHFITLFYEFIYLCKYFMNFLLLYFPQTTTSRVREEKSGKKSIICRFSFAFSFSHSYKSQNDEWGRKKKFKRLLIRSIMDEWMNVSDGDDDENEPK